MSTELADNATKQEIQQFVNEIIEDRKGDEPKKTDSQRIAEEHDEPVTDIAAETESGSDDAASDGEGASEGQAREWLDDDLKAEVAAYGIDETELADFTTREELERALRFFDRSALEVGRKALAEDAKEETQESEPARDEHGKFVKTKEGGFEVNLDKDIYDEGLVEALTQMRDHYESRIRALESRFVEAEAQAEERQFDAFVDALDMPKLFGVTGKENAQQVQTREDLLIASKAQQMGLRSYGRDVAFDQSLINRVARMVHSDEFTKKELKARTRRFSKQADSRMGGGDTKSHTQPEPLREEMRRLYKRYEDS